MYQRLLFVKLFRQLQIIVMRSASYGWIFVLILPQMGCTFLFPFVAVGPPAIEEYRTPPPEQAPRFNEDPRHDAPLGSKNHFGAALAAGQFTRPRSGQGNVEVAIGAPNADVGEGKVVRLLKTSPGDDEVIEVLLPGPYGLMGHPRFGAALASGDFDNDNYDDLAIGAPDDGESGSVVVQYGGPTRRWTILRPPNDTTGKRNFGSALATGDFDNDGRDDLTIGEPGPERGRADDPARVWVIWGRRAADPPISMGLSTLIPIPAGEEQENATRFGSSLAVGNFVLRPDRSQPILPDLAIGAPLFDRPVVRRSDVGRVYVFKSIPPNPQVNGFELAVTLEPRDGWENYAKQFGYSLTAGDFNGDNDAGEAKVDLAIGAPQSSIPEHDNLDGTSPPSGKGRTPGAGLVFIAPHLTSAVSTTLRVLSQDRMGLSQKGDHFGWGLVGADFNRDGFDDLAIGSPNERMAGPDLSGAKQGGALYFRFGNEGEWHVGGGIPQKPQACFDYIDAVRGLAFSRKSDRFGSVLLATLLNNDNAIDLLVGAPETDVEGADGLVKDAGAIWIGLNEATTPGPFDGDFICSFRDDACDEVLQPPADLTFDIHNRDEAVCGKLTANRNLCFEVDGEVVRVGINTSVIANNLGDNPSMHLEYPVTNPADNNRKVGTIFVDASVPVDENGVPDPDGDLTVDLFFRGSGVERNPAPIVCERQ